MKLIDELNQIRTSTSNVFGVVIRYDGKEFKSDLPFADVPKKLQNRMVVGHDQRKTLPGIMILTLGKDLKES